MMKAFSTRTVLLLLMIIGKSHQSTDNCSIEYGLIGESSDYLAVLVFTYEVCWDFDDATFGNTGSSVMVDSLSDLEEEYTIALSERIVANCGIVSDSNNMAPETVGLLVSPDDAYDEFNDNNCHSYQGKFGIYTAEELTDINTEWLIYEVDSALKTIYPQPAVSYLNTGTIGLANYEYSTSGTDGIDWTHLTATSSPTKAPTEPTVAPSKAPVEPTHAPSDPPVVGGTPSPTPAPTPSPTSSTTTATGEDDDSIDFTNGEIMWAWLENSRYVRPYVYYGIWSGIAVFLLVTCTVLCCDGTGRGGRSKKKPSRESKPLVKL